MASNPLLALLNFSNPGSSPSPNNGAPTPPVRASSPPLQSPPAVATPNATASSLLQSILSPSAKEQGRSIHASRPSSSPSVSSPAPTPGLAPAKSPTAAARSPPSGGGNPSMAANDLLALLSGAGGRMADVEGAEGDGLNDASFHEQGPRAWQQPIGTPPAQSVRSEQSKSPMPTVFDSASLFDMLRQQPNESGRGSTPRDKDIATVHATDSALSPSHLVSPPAVASTSIYLIDRKLHASHHLGGLHDSAGFEDGISSGLEEKTLADGTQHFSLNLAAPQPAGASSLYPAKLEITPISLLTTSFTPSCYVNTESGLSKVARWPCNRVAGMGGKIVMYAMSKGRVRVIDQENGDRILARADVNIRSLFAGQDSEPDVKRLFAATTEKGGLYVWVLEDRFGQSGHDAPIVGQLSADEGKSFVHACWKPSSGNREMIVVQSDGQVAVVQVKELERVSKEAGGRVGWKSCPKQVMTQASRDDRCTVGVSVSSDGSLLALVEAVQSSPNEVHPHLTLLSITHPSLPPHSVSLPLLSHTGCSNISFTSLVDDGSDRLPRSVVIGFDDNQVIALLDLATGSYKHVYRFNAQAGPSFSLAAWHSTTSSLIMCCSLRSSIFSLRPRFAKLPRVNVADANVIRQAGLEVGQSMDQSSQVLYRLHRNLLPLQVLEAQPRLRECVLPEPYISFALDDADNGSSAIRILASHLGGIHALVVPEEALKQSVSEQQSEEEHTKMAAHGNADLETAPVQGVQEPLQSRAIPSEEGAAEDVKPPTQPSHPTGPRITSGSPVPEGVAGTEGRGPNGQGKQGEGRKKQTSSRTTSKGAKASRTAGEEEGASKVVRGGESRSGLDGEEVRALLERCETSIVELLKGQASRPDAGQGDERGVAQALSDRLVPALQAKVDEAVIQELPRAIAASLSQSLPNELHKMLLRPDLHSHLTRSITTSILPPIQKTAMDVVSRALAPHFEAVMNDATARIEAKMEMAITGIRKDIVTEQSKALLDTEAGMKDMMAQLSALTRLTEGLVEQNAKMERRMEEMRREGQGRTEGNASKGYSQQATPAQTPLYQGFPGHHHQPTPAFAPPPTNHYSPLPPAQSDQTRPLYTQPAGLPPPAPEQPLPGQQDRGAVPNQEVEDILLGALSAPNIESDPGPLRSALGTIESRWGSPMAAIWGRPSTQNTPNAGKPAVSQAVILTLLHRLINTLAKESEEGSGKPEMDVLWIETCASALDKADETIARVVEGIKRDMVDSLFRAHQSTKRSGRANWWTEERLALRVLRFLQ